MGRFFGFGMSSHTYPRLGRPSRLPTIHPTRMSLLERFLEWWRG